MLLNDPAELKTIPKKIISLVPSQTELLHFLGLDNETIAITKFCIHPHSWFQKKPKIGGTKSLNTDKIISLQPDLLIANKEENVKEQVDQLASQFPVWVTDVHDITGALQMISDIGQLSGKQEAASSLVNNINNAFDQLNLPERNFKTAYLIWRNPYMTIGSDTFIHSIMKAAGLQNVFSHLERYPETNPDELRALNCEVLLLSSEPYPFEKKHVEELKACLPGTKILLADGEMFSWYGSRLLQTPAYLAGLINAISTSVQ